MHPRECSNCSHQCRFLRGESGNCMGSDTKHHTDALRDGVFSLLFSPSLIKAAAFAPLCPRRCHVGSAWVGWEGLSYGPSIPKVGVQWGPSSCTHPRLDVFPGVNRIKGGLLLVGRNAFFRSAALLLLRSNGEKGKKKPGKPQFGCHAMCTEPSGA